LEVALSSDATPGFTCCPAGVLSSLLQPDHVRSRDVTGQAPSVRAPSPDLKDCRAPRRVISRRAWASSMAEALVARLSPMGEILDVVLTGG
jgi:hypothetical protein